MSDLAPRPRVVRVAARVPGKAPANATDVSRARKGLEQARHMRASYLVAVAEGTMTPLDVIQAATTATGRPLRKILLRNLLLAVPGNGPLTVDNFLSAVAFKLGQPDASWRFGRWLGSGRTANPLRDANIEWLLATEASGGSRVLAWIDTERQKDQAWAGFPFTPGNITRGAA